MLASRPILLEGVGVLSDQITSNYDTGIIAQACVLIVATCQVAETPAVREPHLLQKLDFPPLRWKEAGGRYGAM